MALFSHLLQHHFPRQTHQARKKKPTTEKPQHSRILRWEGHIFCHPECRLIIRVSGQGLRSHYQQIDDAVQENKQQRCQIERISDEVPWEAA